MHALRIKLGLFIILVHLGLLIALVLFWTGKGFLFEEMTTAIGLIGPLFAAYTTTIIVYVIENPGPLQSTEEPVGKPFIFLSFFLPGMFAGVIALAIVLWAFRIGFTDFEQFKILVFLSEGAFGIYMGQLVNALFRKRKAEKSSRAPDSTRGQT